MSKKYTIKECTAFAITKGGKCLNTEYKNCNTLMHWECSNKHIWIAKFQSLKNSNSWCPFCASNTPRTIDDCHLLAEKNNGRCLNKKYTNNKLKLLWECSNKHQWYASFNKVSIGQWCPKCRFEKNKMTCLVRYGATNPMQHPDIARKSAAASARGFILHWKYNTSLDYSSSWEKAVIEYLNLNKIDFLWQPTVFKLSSGLTYRPDLYLVNENKWIEIKGYWRGISKDKWTEFSTKIHTNSELWDKPRLRQLGILVR